MAARVNSRAKGARGERALCALLRSLGYEARRSQQYQGVRGVSDSADVVHNIPGLKLECKLGYNSAEAYGTLVQEWVTTVISECAENERWLILWKRDRKDWDAIFIMNGLLVRTYDVAGAIRYLST